MLFNAALMCGFYHMGGPKVLLHSIIGLHEALTLSNCSRQVTLHRYDRDSPALRH